jgi:hypothetical protein
MNENVKCDHSDIYEINPEDNVWLCRKCDTALIVINGQIQTELTREQEEILSKINQMCVKGEFYDVKVQYETGGGQVTCDNLGNLDPREIIKFTGNQISLFREFAPFSDYVKKLIYRETAEYELMQHGCRNFKWNLTNPGERLGNKIHSLKNYQNTVYAGYSFLGFGGFFGFIFLSFFSIWSIILGIMLGGVGGLLVVMYRPLNIEYRELEQDILRESNAVFKIPKIMAELKKRWLEKDKKMKKQFQVETEITDLATSNKQYQEWKSKHKNQLQHQQTQSAFLESMGKKYQVSFFWDRELKQTEYFDSILFEDEGCLLIPLPDHPYRSIEETIGCENPKCTWNSDSIQYIGYGGCPNCGSKRIGIMKRLEEKFTSLEVYDDQGLIFIYDLDFEEKGELVCDVCGKINQGIHMSSKFICEECMKWDSTYMHPRMPS